MTNIAPEIDEIWQNPKKYLGFTFEEYCQNPEKYKWGRDKQAAMIDNSTTSLKNLVKSQSYYVEGFRCDSLAQAERIANDMGIDIFDASKCETDIQQIQEKIGELKYIVNFKRKSII